VWEAGVQEFRSSGASGVLTLFISTPVEKNGLESQSVFLAFFYKRACFFRIQQLLSS
jgi:hypothetical protein